MVYALIHDRISILVNKELGTPLPLDQIRVGMNHIVFYLQYFQTQKKAQPLCISLICTAVVPCRWIKIWPKIKKSIFFGA